jgi:hypothetical protein
MSDIQMELEGLEFPLKPGLEVHACNLSTATGGSQVQGKPGFHSMFESSLCYRVIPVLAGHRWLMPIILVTQEAEIRSIAGFLVLFFCGTGV